MLLAMMLCLFFMKTNLIHSQTVTKNKFNTGIDLPSGFFAGIDHRFSSWALGVDASTWLGTIYPIQYIAFTVDNSFYFGAADTYNFKTWFLDGRLIYSSVFEKYSNKPVAISLVPGLGKDFNITSEFGISLTAGIDMTIFQKDRSGVYIPIGTYYELNKSIKPSFKVVFSYRF
jgi:hypothetical protein